MRSGSAPADCSWLRVLQRGTTTAGRATAAVALLSLLVLLGRPERALGLEDGLEDGVVVQQVTPPCQHAEGPVWDEQLGGLFFVDVEAQHLHLYRPGDGGGLRGVRLGGSVSPVVVLHNAGGGGGPTLIVGVGRELQLVGWSASDFGPALPRPPAVLAAVEADKPGNRFNDGKVDAEGRIWIGTMGPEPVVGQVTPNQGALYRITLANNNISNKSNITLQQQQQGIRTAEVTSVLSPVSVSNGLAWDADETLMYYIDSPTRRVDVFDFDRKKGTIANRRPAFDFAVNNVTGVPDGMTIDSDGKLWVACFGGSQVIQVDPAPAGGRLLRRVAVPASQVTSVAFGGAAGDTLFVTTMRRGLSEEQLRGQPGAGAVFAVTGTGARRAAQGQGPASASSSSSRSHSLLHLATGLLVALSLQSRTRFLPAYNFQAANCD